MTADNNFTSNGIFDQGETADMLRAAVTGLADAGSRAAPRGSMHTWRRAQHHLCSQTVIGEAVRSMNKR